MSEVMLEGYISFNETDETKTSGSYVKSVADSSWQGANLKVIEYIVKDTYVDDLADEVLELSAQDKADIWTKIDNVYQNYQDNIVEQLDSKLQGITDDAARADKIQEIITQSKQNIYDNIVNDMAKDKMNLASQVDDFSELIDQPNLTTDEIVDFLDQRALSGVSYNASDNIPTESQIDDIAKQVTDDFIEVNRGIELDDIVNPTRLPSSMKTTGKIFLREAADGFALLGFGVGVATDILIDGESPEQALVSQAAGLAAGALAVTAWVLAAPATLPVTAVIGIGAVISIVASSSADWLVDWRWEHDKDQNKTRFLNDDPDADLQKVLEVSAKIIASGDVSGVEIETPAKVVDITEDPANNEIDVNSTGSLTAKEVVNIVDSTVANNSNTNQVNINDQVNQFIAEWQPDNGNSINIIDTTGEMVNDIAGECAGSGLLLRGRVTLTTGDPQGTSYTMDYDTDANQKIFTTNNSNMTQLGGLAQDASQDGSDVSITTEDGDTIIGQQQEDGTIVLSGSVEQNVQKTNDIQVGFIESVTKKTLTIAANIFGTVLSPFSGLLNVANNVLSQVTNFLGGILNSIFGAFYEDGTLTYDESLSIADKTGEILQNDQAISKTELLNLDTNDDGVIDSNEMLSANLEIWQDIDEDGVADDGEIKSLSDAGIISINTEDADLYTAGNADSLVRDMNHDWYINQSYTIRRFLNGGSVVITWNFSANTVKLFDDGATAVGTTGNDELPHIFTLGSQSPSYTENFYPIKYISGSGDDLVTANHRNNEIYGGTGNDHLSGQEGNDLILGEDGNDNTTGGVGSDTIYGGEGDDLIIGMNPDYWIDATTGEQYPAPQELQPGETDDDKLYGGAGSDTILGRAGNDYIDGGAGADSMEGGDGDDIYIVNTVNDVILEYQDQGHDKVFSNVTYLLNSDVEDLKLISDESIHGTGNKLDNTIIGNSGNNILDGVTGADTMIGQAGDDIYYVDDSNDIIVEKADEGNDTVQTSISYILSENIENINLLSFSTPEKGLIDGEMVHVYGYPKQYELDYMQGDKNPEYRGTCALTAISNLFVQSGDNFTEEDIVNYAVQNDLTVTEAESEDPLERGGTSMQEQIAILEGFGLQTTTLLGYSAEEIATKIRAGHGVIMGVNCGTLWDAPESVGDGSVNHIITISGVVYNSDDTEIVGFYICDSGRQKVSDMTRYVSLADFEEAANVENAYAFITVDPIKLWDPDIDAIGNVLDNKIIGNEGDNVLDGGEGEDLLIGNAGNDRYIVDNVNDHVSEDVNSGTDTVESSISYALDLNNNVENIELSGNTDINATGNELNNVVTGNAGNNVLDGGEGNDEIIGGEGNDTIIGGVGNDFLKDATGNDEYRISAGDGQDVIIDFNGTDRIVFASDINEADLEYSVNSYDLVVTNTVTSDTLTITNWFKYENNKIEEFYFENGSQSLNIEQIHNKVKDANEGMFQERISIVLEDGTAISQAELVAFDLDSNGVSNGVIDSNDISFNNLKVWQDANEDGIGDVGEIKTLTEAGIIQIRTENADVFTSGNGNYFDANDLDQINQDDVSSLATYVLPTVDEPAKLIKSPSTLYGDITSANKNDFSIGTTENADIFYTGTDNDTVKDDYVPLKGGDDEVDAGLGNDVLLGEAGNDLLLGRADNDYLDGGIGNDTLVGHDGNNYLDGGAGNDEIHTSGDDYDSVFGGIGNDTIISHNGNYIDAEAGNDLIYELGAGDDTIFGGTEDDWVEAGYGNDYVNGEQGADVLYGQVGNDTVIGGDGNDFVRGFTRSDETKQTLDAGETDNDVLLGGAGDDTLVGMLGDDTLIAGTDNDQLYGESDNDILYGEGGADSLYGGTGTDTLLGGSGDDRLFGEVGDDTLAGGSGNDVISGFTADEDPKQTLEAGESDNDTIYGESGNDLVIGSVGNDFVSGGEGNDSIYGFTEPGATKVTLETGETDDDVLSGNAGDDLLVGGFGNDTVFGGTENDELHGNEGNDFLYGEEGDDSLYGEAGDDIAYGGEGNDTISGEADNDKLYGGMGDDSLVGGTGDDYVDGGIGVDTMTGGVGDDIYVVNSFNDVIVENAGEGIDKVISNITYALDSNVEEIKLIGMENLNAYGNDSDNKISGNSGNNILDGSTGADEMSGQLGDDTYIVDNVGDLVSENADEGIDTVKSEVDYTLTDNVENLELVGACNINASGNTLDNTITGNAGNNILLGAQGDDTYYFTGEWGNDEVVDTLGVDRVLFGDDFLSTNVNISRENDNVVISKVGSTDRIVLKDWFVSADNRVETIEFTDGTLNATDIETLAVNYAPTATLESANGEEDNNIVIDVLSDASDADGDTLKIDSVTQGANGSVSIGIDNKLIYVPKANFNGADSFDYTISDGNGGVDTKTVTVSISSVNDNPVATVESGTVDEDSSVAIDILASATDVDEDTLNIESFTEAANGTITQDAQDRLVYTPNANFNGTDSFTYTINDGNGGTDSKTITITVDPVNDAPTTTSFSKTTSEDQQLTITDALSPAYVNDVDGDPLSLEPNPTADHGTVTVDGSNLVYTPEADYNGSDTITYNVSDGNGGITENTINVTIDPVNDAPTATPFSATTSEDQPLTITDALHPDNVSDIDGDPLSLEPNPTADHGTVTVDGDNFIYTPEANYNGSDTITYSVSDDKGEIVPNTITITITPDANYEFNEGDGQVNITNPGDYNVIQLGTGIAEANLEFVRQADDLVINMTNPGDQITVQDWFLSPDNKIGSIEFLSGDAPITTSADIESKITKFIGTDNADNITGNQNDNILDGGTGADTLAGGLGDDTYIIDDISDTIIENAGEGTDTAQSSVTYVMVDNLENLELTGITNINATGNDLDNLITGNSGNNTIDGGLGVDSIVGGAGDDTYLFDQNDGWNIITDTAGNDKIVLGEGISISNVIFTRDSYLLDSLNIQFNNSLDKITIYDYYNGTDNKIEILELSDGSTYDLANIYDWAVILGTSGDDYIEVNDPTCNVFYGGQGNDVIIDWSETIDTYIFGLGDGQDVIADTFGDDKILFGEGITSNDIEFVRYTSDPYHLTVKIDGTTDQITMYNYYTGYAGKDTKIETLEFSDGSTIDVATMTNQVMVEGTSGDDSIDVSDDFNNTYVGSAGSDYFADAGSSDDTYQFDTGHGVNIISDTAGTNDKIHFDSSSIKNTAVFYKDGSNLYIDYGTTAGVDLIGIANQDTNTIERFELENGEFLTDSDVNQLIQDVITYANDNSITINTADDIRNNSGLMNIVTTAWHS